MVSKILKVQFVYQRDCAHRTQKRNGQRMYGPGYRRAYENSEEGVDKLQAAEPPCSVSNGPVKITLKTSVSGGLIYRTKHWIAR